MSLHVDVSRIGSAASAEVHELETHLRSTHLRFRNSVHAQTRAYTCRRMPEPYELHWNDHDVPGESLLGSWGWAVPHEVFERVAAELVHGRAVRLFIFNSDGDLCFQELLQLTSSRTTTRG